MNTKNKSALGILCVIIGFVITVVAAGELLIRLILAGAGLYLANYGFKLWQNRSLHFFLWSLRNKW